MKRTFLLFLLVLALVVGWTVSAAPNSKFELHNGDRVVFIGGVFMEREQEDGHIEAMLTRHFLDREISFRNLGWSGDTVESYLHPLVPARPPYVPKLFDYVEKLKPTVIFVSYGMMESFRGEAGLNEFVKNYNELLDKLGAAKTSSQSTKPLTLPSPRGEGGRRPGEGSPQIVIVSPFRHEDLGGHFPDPTEHNRNLKLYVEAIRKMASERGLTFVDLFEHLDVAPKSKRPVTNNGVHLTSYGYQQAATVIEKELGLAKAISSPKRDWRIEEALRPAIQHKNLQWWYHYKPMNSEYVYPGGERYQNELGGIKHPMFEEIEEFARRAEAEDKTIAELCKKLSGHVAQASSLQVKKLPASTQDASQPAGKMPALQPDPELERKTFQIADGFNVELFAADPRINKPVQIAFDAKGRLWVATTTLYPQIKPGEEPTDKIIILEDTNGDGRADKTTIFADGLYIPTGVLPTKDGAYVSDDTKVYFFRDRDGDGRADEKEVVLSGFGTEDSHHKVHVLRWGTDGRFYFNVGVFLHNNVETPYGVVSQAGHWNAGILGYRPESGQLETYLANSVPPNPWGHYWNRWGFDFHIDSSGQQGSNFILPTSNRTSSAIPVPGGGGKLAGGEILSGRHLPNDWQGCLIAAPFKENRVARFQFSDDSSGYALKSVAPIIVSTDPAFRPVDHRMGPDGAIYIADWYNPLIGHMQHHFRDPGRDFTHGRIWRVTAKDRPLVAKPKIADASVKQLLEHLKAPEDFTRLQARRELSTRNTKEVSAALAKWVKGLNANDPDYDHHRIEALWVYENINVIAPELLKSLLQAKEPNARAAAVATLRRWSSDAVTRDKLKLELQPLDLLEPLVHDENPRVRLQTVTALSYFAEKRAMELATMVLDKPMDNYIEQALKNTAIALKSTWEPLLVSDDKLFGGDGKKLEHVLNAAGAQANPKSLLALLKLKNVSRENFDKSIGTIGQNGDKEDLLALFRMDFEDGQQAKVLAAVSKAFRERKIVLKITPDSTKRLENWMKSSNENLKAEAIRLAGAWKDESLRERFVEIARDDKSSETLRKAALAGLASLGVGSKEALLELSRIQTPKPVRDAGIAALAEVSLVDAIQRVLDILCGKPESEQEITRLLNMILSRDHGGNMSEIIRLTIEQPSSPLKINADNAKLALRAMQLNGRTSGLNQILMQQFSRFAGINAEAKELSREELQHLAADVRTKGDVARGEQIFRRQELMCFQCHAINGAGGLVGPDLGAVGTGSQVDYLIESILNPSKIIKDGFETWEVVTKDGESTLGIKVRENPQELVLKDAARNEIVIPQNSITSKENKKVSLMPAGLTAGLTQSELLDLVRFLSELGKPGPYANNPNPIVRRWQIAASAQGNLKEADSAEWTPVYSLVSGVLPLEEISKVTKGLSKTAFARCQFEVTTAGKIQFRVNSPEGLTLWIDGKPTELKPVTTVELGRGVHWATFAVDLNKRRDGLLMEFEQVADSPGRFQLVSGK